MALDDTNFNDEELADRAGPKPLHTLEEQDPRKRLEKKTRQTRNAKRNQSAGPFEQPNDKAREKHRSTLLRAKKIIKRRPSLKQSVVGIKVVTAVASAWMVFVVLYVLQIVGAAFEVAGFAVIYGASIVPLVGEEVGDLFGGDELVVLGIMIALIAANLSYVVVTLLLALRGVNAFSSTESIFVFALTLGAHTIPGLNFIPLGVFWLLFIIKDHK